MSSLQARGARSVARVWPHWRAVLLAGWLGFSCTSRPSVEPHVVVPPSAGVASNYSVPGAASRPAPSSCPMTIEGAEVLFVPIEGGGALVFTSSLTSPAVMRRAVRRFVQACQSGAVRPGPVGIATSVRYADTVAGARVEILAQTAAQLTQLHQYLRRLAFEMREHRSCDVAEARLSTR